MVEKKHPHVKGLEGKSLCQKIPGSFGWMLWLVVFYLQEIEITCFWLLKSFRVCSKWYVGKTQWFMMALQFCPLWNKGDFARKCCVVLSKPFCQPNKKARYTRCYFVLRPEQCCDQLRPMALFSWLPLKQRYFKGCIVLASMRWRAAFSTLTPCLVVWTPSLWQPFVDQICGGYCNVCMANPEWCRSYLAALWTVLMTCFKWPSLSMALFGTIRARSTVWALLHRDCAGLTAC